MDKYTKFILTMIAIGILGLNYHLFKGEIVSPVHAASNEVHKIAICNEYGSRCADILVARRGTGESWHAFATR
tara:strand:+ start:278 stop:496 length:219 start_codon:yes stop_codon:yes gene_type:complete